MVERRTLSRAFPTARAVLRQLLQRVRLQEACFSDVVVIFRRAAGGTGSDNGGGVQVRLAGEEDRRSGGGGSGICLRHLRGIPLADLELVVPEKRIWLPPSVWVQVCWECHTHCTLLLLLTVLQAG